MAKDRSYPNIRPAIATAVTSAIKASEDSGTEHHAQLVNTGRGVRFAIIEGPAPAKLPKDCAAIVVVAFTPKAKSEPKAKAEKPAPVEKKATAKKADVKVAAKKGAAAVTKKAAAPKGSAPANPQSAVASTAKLTPSQLVPKSGATAK